MRANTVDQVKARDAGEVLLRGEVAGATQDGLRDVAAPESAARPGVLRPRSGMAAAARSEAAFPAGKRCPKRVCQGGPQNGVEKGDLKPSQKCL